jgi:hypothetical protein
MAKLLATFPKPAASIEAVLTGLKIGPQDTFRITGSSNSLSVHIKKPNGTIRSAKLKAKGSFRQLTSFDPTTLTIEERRKLTKQLFADGISQTEIGNMLGVSQGDNFARSQKNKPRALTGPVFCRQASKPLFSLSYSYCITGIHFV